jgi:8-oxo-dGTP pyrophosphatase MutT (NUDIX family)
MECFYRVSTKVLLVDVTSDGDEFVVLKNSKGEYELPGGGMEYGESIALSIEREVDEELEIKIKVEEKDLNPIFFDAYKSRSHDIWVAFALYKVTARKV